MPPIRQTSEGYYIKQLTPREVDHWYDIIWELANSNEYTEGLEDLDLRLVFGAFTAHGQLVGFASLRRYSGYWYLRSCVIDEEHRGHGLQRRLVRARVRHIEEYHPEADRINAWVNLRNRWSKTNLETEGFEATDDVVNNHVKMRYYLE